MHQRAKQIKLLILDVDGVMTDGSLYFTDNGAEIKAFNSLDGHGMNMLRSTGIQLAIITGRCSQLVEHRANNLGVKYVFQGAKDKLAAFTTLLTESGFTAQECGYVGDDVIDLPVMRRVHFAATVPGAPEIVRQNAHYVTSAEGGKGAVREICELVMQAQGTYEALLNHYLR
jgi:3-deoxy-D-manno-octulosonate 8-phosphate phosphatase (KDO 8-P phosphatase)